MEAQRRIGLFGATSIGVGAIVGGGILALAGTAFHETGAGALLAFGLNGLIALATALSFAELGTAFPRSGGTYAFAKRALPIGPAFCVGWVACFASVVAGALYALGFAAFLLGGLESLLGEANPVWLRAPEAVTTIGAASAAGGGLVVARATGGGGVLVNVTKIAVFAILIGGGLWVWLRSTPAVVEPLTPLLPNGSLGLMRAMGFTFIALQGFDLIAAVSGEVKDPGRVLPRAMLLSLAIALGLYLPMLAIVLVVGVPAGTSIAELSASHPDTLIAVAAANFLGPTGFWLVVVAGLLSMLSAMLANLYAASRIAQVMARDRTLPSVIARVHAKLGTPVIAVSLTAALCVAVIVLMGDVATAGAASSLIFLLTFVLANVLCIVTRRRKPRHGGFRVPLWPFLPIAGTVLCAALAVFQGAAVPTAGLIAGGWLAVGGVFYLGLFAKQARVSDAVDEAVDAELLELRGRSPLVLVPMDTSTDAGVLALFAACVSPPRVGRVLLLNILPPYQELVPEEFDENLEQTSERLRSSMRAAVRAGARTEGLATVGLDRWDEIERVARTHRCAAVLIGMQKVSDADLRGHLESLATRLLCDVVLLRVPLGWQPEQARKVLVPIRGSGAHSTLRARLLASLHHRSAPDMEITYLLVLPPTAPESEHERRARAYSEEARLEVSLPSVVRTTSSEDVSAAIVEAAAGCDLLVLGLSRLGRSRAFSEVTRSIIAQTECPLLVLSQRV